MGLILNLAKKLQRLDVLVPLRWRVPFRYMSQRMVGGLEPEMSLLSQLVPSDKVAVDVGGNRGTYAYALSKLAREVLTFEPVPECTRLLNAWARDRNVTVHECGLGDREDTLVLHVPRIRGSLFTTRASFARRDEGEGLNLSVKIRALDQFGLGDVGFMKIDVEGFELPALKGARETLERCRPNLLVEIDPEHQTREEFSATFEWLESAGYAAHYLDEGSLYRCGAEVQTRQPPRYNFIFLPQDQG